MISPFFNVLVYASLIAVVFNPVLSGFPLVRGHTGIAAILSTFVDLGGADPAYFIHDLLVQEGFSL